MRCQIKMCFLFSFSIGSLRAGSEIYTSHKSTDKQTSGGWTHLGPGVCPHFKVITKKSYFTQTPPGSWTEKNCVGSCVFWNTPAVKKVYTCRTHFLHTCSGFHFNVLHTYSFKDPQGQGPNQRPKILLIGTTLAPHAQYGCSFSCMTFCLFFLSLTF